jgi:hypothetical protein
VILKELSVKLLLGLAMVGARSAWTGALCLNDVDQGNTQIQLRGREGKFNFIAATMCDL